MEVDIVKKIAEKASALPLEAQQKALAYVESLEREEMSKENRSVALGAYCKKMPKLANSDGQRKASL